MPITSVAATHSIKGYGESAMSDARKEAMLALG